MQLISGFSHPVFNEGLPEEINQAASVEKADPRSMFKVAFPYVATPLATGGLGLFLAASSSNPLALTIMGLVMAILGSASGFGALICAITSKDATAFEGKVYQYMATSAAAHASQFISEVAKMLILNLIFGKSRD